MGMMPNPYMGGMLPPMPGPGGPGGFTAPMPTPVDAAPMPMSANARGYLPPMRQNMIRPAAYRPMYYPRPYAGYPGYGPMGPMGGYPVTNAYARY
jgi:hypothetical protein